MRYKIAVIMLFVLFLNACELCFADPSIWGSPAQQGAAQPDAPIPEKPDPEREEPEVADPAADEAETDDSVNEYTDDQGNTVTVIEGAKAFADKVVSFNIGSPAPQNPKFANPEEALGEPDYSGFTGNSDTMWGFVSLGGGGVITLEFTQVYIVDGPGADIHVFEVGPAVEPMLFEISRDGEDWIVIGEISGGTASVDLAGHVDKNDRFSFVRLTDLNKAGGEWPGADLDAVAAINTVRK